MLFSFPHIRLYLSKHKGASRCARTSVRHLTAALLYLQVQEFACQPFKDLYIDQRVGKNEQAAVTVRSKGVVALRAQAEGRHARREGAIRAAVPALPAPSAPCAAYLEAMEQAELRGARVWVHLKQRDRTGGRTGLARRHHRAVVRAHHLAERRLVRVKDRGGVRGKD